MLHDMRLAHALMDRRAATASAMTTGRASPMRLRVARWLVQAGTRLQGGDTAAGARVVAFEPGADPAPELAHAA